MRKGKRGGRQQYRVGFFLPGMIGFSREPITLEWDNGRGPTPSPEEVRELANCVPPEDRFEVPSLDRAIDLGMDFSRGGLTVLGGHEGATILLH